MATDAHASSKPELRREDSVDDVGDSPSGVASSRSHAEPASPEKSDSVQKETRPIGVMRRKKTKLPADAHKVTFTVTVAKAVPSYDDDDSHDGEDGKQKRRSVDAPRAQAYYHTEYHFLPTDNEPVKTDVVMFGVAAKVYADRQDPRVVRTWQEGDRTWVTWTLTHSVQVTADLLKKLYQHTLQLKIWDTKEKCSTRAKFDRPKAFRLPASKDGVDDTNGVRSMILQQAQAYLDCQPKQSYIERPLPAETPSILSRASDVPESRAASSDRGRGGSRISDTGQDLPEPPGRPVSPPITTLVSVPNQGAAGVDFNRTYSRLGQLAGMTSPAEKPKSDSRASKATRKTAPVHKPLRKSPTEKRASPSKPDMLGAPSMPENHARKSMDTTGSPAHSPTGPVLDPSQTKKSKKSDPGTQLLAEHVKKHGIATVPIRMAEFYAGRTTVTNRLDSPVSSVNDLFITVSLNEPLVSEEQKKMLNPLVFTIQTLSHMPNHPLTFEQLHNQCLPVSCQYQLFKQPSLYKTLPRRHGPHVHFNDINVFLLGTMDHETLHEYLSGPLLQIEVHDRDRKPLDEKLDPALFGDELDDEKISNVGVVASRRTTNNPFTDRGKHWDPYGLAKFDLSGLLRGERLIEVNIPVQPCPMPDLLGGEGGSDKLVGLPGAIDGPADPPLPAGEYLASGTTLKIRADLALGLSGTSDRVPSAVKTEAKCPFGRLVAVFDHNNTSFLSDLHSLVVKNNATALQLEDMPVHVLQLALATYKLSRDQQTSRTLDLLTGFHLIDGIRHIIMLEGLLAGALTQLWKELPQERGDDVAVYYNADLTFTDRIYHSLDVDLTKVKLHEPLDSIVQRSLLYVRDIVPKPCFQALSKLHQLLSMNKLRDIVRNDLFPSADEVLSVSKEFGVPITGDDFQQEPVVRETSQGLSARQASRYSFPVQQRRRWTPMDNYNPDYLQYLQHLDEFPIQRDYVRDNIEVVKCQSAKNHEERQKTKKQTVSATVRVPHNYSTQNLNSTEQAKDKIRQMLAEKPDERYTYCQDYHHSMTVVPVNVERLEKEAKMESRRRWKTESGWTYPGMRANVEDNEHPQRPPQARIDQLKEEWEENILHRTIQQPPLSGRECFPWTRRHTDFDTWKKPEPMFDVDVPLTVHLVGDLRDEEQLMAATKDYEKWRRQICVDTLDVKCHRVLPATEMTERGPTASNQISKIESILKDPAKKYGIRYPGIHHCPPLSVVNNPSVDTLGRKIGRMFKDAEPLPPGCGFGPGPFSDHTWTIDKNTVPRRNYDRRQFADKRGQDFNVYHKDRSVLSDRRRQRTLSQHVDTSVWNIPRAESYHHQDDLEYLPAAAIRFINRGLQQVES